MEPRSAQFHPYSRAETELPPTTLLKGVDWCLRLAPTALAMTGQHVAACGVEGQQRGLQRLVLLGHQVGKVGLEALEAVVHGALRRQLPTTLPLR